MNLNLNLIPSNDLFYKWEDQSVWIAGTLPQFCSSLLFMFILVQVSFKSSVANKSMCIHVLKNQKRKKKLLRKNVTTWQTRLK